MSKKVKSAELFIVQVLATVCDNAKVDPANAMNLIAALERELSAQFPLTISEAPRLVSRIFNDHGIYEAVKCPPDLKPFADGHTCVLDELLTIQFSGPTKQWSERAFAKLTHVTMILLGCA